MTTVIRFLVLLPFTYPLYLSQRYWGERVWRLAGRVPSRGLRYLVRAALVMALLALALPGFWWIISGSRRPGLQTVPFAVSGLWLSSTFFSWVGLKLVQGTERAWAWLAARFARASGQAEAPEPAPADAGDSPANPHRRYFFQTAGYLAGAVPFVGAVYGFAVERLQYRVERVEVPIPNLPEALDGLRIGQLSDVHIGGYMGRDQVRRAVEMANELAPELFVFTGDFVTAAGDPLGDCIEELARLRAPLGAWACNGNHEVYAGCEDQAARLCRQAGIRLLRLENAELAWHGEPFNLMGVDYQPSGSFRWPLPPMLAGVERLMRPQMPNILLSHNPNAFVRALEMGIDLTLAGHTHGGQIQVEIIDSRLNPARFFTEFVAGLYARPLGVPRKPGEASVHEGEGRTAHLYVNRGLGTVGAPVRIGSPPEISLLVLRRA